ncbi:MAG: hypothetical protein E6J75_11860 [Deltaproteobacteria bacterium]|nr:MAG: hypothetical protein E6J75_11860 [Deltaproteobacteria bacterium]
MTITDALNDLRDRATAERDATTFATIVEVQKYLPTAAASQPVPDMTGTAPFRASDFDPEVGADQRGVNRRLS